MKIIVCEDEAYWSDVLNQAVSKWAASRRIDLKCSCFASSQELISHLSESCDDDVLFLDLVLGEEIIDGMGLAKRIRKMGFAIPIIFVTSNILRAADGYLVEAMGYLQKPIDQDRLSLFLDRVYKRKKKHKLITIVHDGRVTSILLKDVVYAEVCDHTITYHTSRQSLSQRGTVYEILENLKGEDFVRIHRSFVVMLDKIDNIKTKYPYSVDVLKNNERVSLPVSRKYIANLLEMYSDDLMEKMI